MRNYLPNSRQLSAMIMAAALALTGASLERSLAESPSPTYPSPIPMDQIGAVAGKQYSGDGLSVVRVEGGALLRCVFQRLDGEATRDGLWLTSTVADQVNDRFRVKAVAVGQKALPESGVVSVEGQTVRFSRAGLVEEYSVSMDGVRQDFLVLEKPMGKGGLKVQLDVAGAKVEQTVAGAQLVLEKSGRKIAYSRLKVTDAKDKELMARIEVKSNSALSTPHSEFALAVAVDDAEASYPIRIDPTFSDANWVSLGGLAGADSGVRAVAVDGGGNLYVGGMFTSVGTTNANCVAKWDGNSWHPLGAGINNTVYALAVSGSDVYAGGSFTTAGGILVRGIAKWDGTTWNALGSGVSGMTATVNAVAVSGSDVYVTGSFSSAGGVSANAIAKWNGSSWSALGTGLSRLDGFPFAAFTLAVSGSTVFVGGGFTHAGGIAANYVAMWDGAAWSPLGTGMNSSVYALALNGGILYAGGAFTSAGGSPASYVAAYDGFSWNALGAGMNNQVTALVIAAGDVVAGGNFATAGGSQVNYIAKWNGANWSAMGSGMTFTVFALAASGANVYAGGDFNLAGGKAAKYVAKWNGSDWAPVSGGATALSSTASALALMGGDIYVGGAFSAAGSNVVNFVAKWNGATWSALGSGLNGFVDCLTVSGSNLYVGGNFTYATNTGLAAVRVNRIAKWDGNNWSALGVGLDARVYGVSVAGNNLFVGGVFIYATNAGLTAVRVNRIAKWDGDNWSALALGMDSRVSALAISGSDLYVGGDFTYGTNVGPSAVAANRVARWDGNNWSALGLGMNERVRVLAVSGSDVYAGGGFTTAGGTAANRIAKWNGTSWSALGSGLDGWVYALAVSGSELLVGGAFTYATNAIPPAVGANRIAKWDGSTWHSLASGVNSDVTCLVIWKTNLFAGGAFTIAGGKVSAYVARVILPPPPVLIVTTNAGFGISNGVFGFNLAGIAGQTVVTEAATNLANPTWVPLKTNTLTGDILYFSDPQWTNFSGRFYRIRTQ